MAKKSKTRQKQKESKAQNSSNPFAFLDQKAYWMIILLGIFPFVQSKVTIDPNIAIRILAVSIFVLVYLLYFYVIRKNKIEWGFPRIINVIYVSLILFIIWSILSLLGATNQPEALYEVSRYGLNLILLFIGMTAVMDKNFNWKPLVNFLILASIGHGLIGLDQKFEWDALYDYRGSAGPYGTMTNRTLYGSFLALQLPFILLPFLDKKYGSRILAVPALIVFAFSIYHSYTKSGWISAAIIFTFVTVVSLIKLKASRKTIVQMALVGIASLAIVMNSGSISPDKKTYQERRAERISEARQKRQSAQTANKEKEQDKNAAATAEKETPEKDDNIIENAGSSTTERIVVWRQTLRMLQDYPLLGVGLGNWKIEIPRYTITTGIRSDYGQIVRIRTHNIYLQVLSETGVPGFLLLYVPWLIILILGLHLIFYQNDQRILAIVIVAGLLGFASDGLFSFPNERISHATICWTGLGFICGLFIKSSDRSKTTHNLRWAVVPALIISAWCIFISNEKYNFEKHMQKARKHYLREKFTWAENEVKLGTSKYVTLEVNNDPIELVAALSLKADKRLEQALTYARKAKSYNPYSTRIMNTEGAILTDLKRYEEAVGSYKEALVYSPKHDLSLQNLALNFYLLEEYDSCLATLDKARVDRSETMMNLQKSARAKLRRQQRINEQANQQEQQ